MFYRHMQRCESSKAFDIDARPTVRQRHDVVGVSKLWGQVDGCEQTSVSQF